MPIRKKLAVKSPKVRGKFSSVAPSLIVEEEIPKNQADVVPASPSLGESLGGPASPSLGGPEPIRSSDQPLELTGSAIDEKEEDKDFWRGDETKAVSLAEGTPEEESEEDSEPQELGFLARSGGSSNTPLSKLLWIVLAVALFVGGIGGGVLIFRQGVEAGKKEASLVTPTPSPEDLQTTMPESTPELNRGNLAVQVLNGAGVPGTAKKAETFLANLGYKVEDTANAKSFDYDKTVISIKESKKEYSQMIVKDLLEKYEVDENTKVLDDDSEFDVIIIIGKK